MLAQINDLPQLELVHWVWIGVGFLALFVISVAIYKINDNSKDS